MAYALTFLAGTGGDLVEASQLLSRQWPRFASFTYAMAYWNRALKAVECRYNLDVPWYRVRLVKPVNTVASATN